VVFILTVYYAVFYDPTLDPFSEDANRRLDRPNAIDMVFYNAKIKLLRPLDGASKRYRILGSIRRKLGSRGGRDVFIGVVMALSDVQIVSGIALLVSGYYSATRGMSGYHWKMMVRVAWFSTITHLGALSCLRSYLYQNQFKRTVRLFFMGCLAVMLIHATLATADIGMHNDMPAVCFLNISQSPTGLKDLDVVVSVLILGYNIFLRILKLHRTTSQRLSPVVKRLFRFLARPIIKFILARLTCTNRYRALRLAIYMTIVQPCVACLVLAKTYYLMYTSMLAEVSVTISLDWVDVDIVFRVDLLAACVSILGHSGALRPSQHQATGGRQMGLWSDRTMRHVPRPSPCATRYSSHDVEGGPQLEASPSQAFR